VGEERVLVAGDGFEPTTK